GAECDLGITKDGRLVLMHDYTLDRTTTGTGNVSNHTLAEIKALDIDTDLRGFEPLKVPTIEEYLNVCKVLGLYPIIEVKQDGHNTGMVDALLPILEKYNIVNDCILISFGLDTLRYIRSKNKSVKLSHILNVGVTLNQSHLNTVKSIGNCTINA